MSVSLTPSKRQLDGSLAEPEGKAKLQKFSNSENEPLRSSSSRIEFRVLCPASKVDGVVGKDGSFTAEVERQSGAKVSVDELISGCDERVVEISFHKDEDVDGEEGVTNEQCEDVKDKETIPNEKGGLSVQAGLLLVFDRMAEVETGADGMYKNNKNSSAFVLRILVPSVQVGCILGKGGSVIKQMSSASGAQIRIVPRDKLPLCVSPLDELVQITGEVSAVRKALHYVSSQIFGSPISANLTATSSSSLSQPQPRFDRFSQFKSSLGGPGDVDYHSVGPAIIHKFREGGVPSRTKPAQEILCFRLLCRSDRIGGVIGTSGQAIMTVQQDTGCDVKVLEGVPGSEDHVIVVSGLVHPDDRISAVQDAVLRVQARISRAGSESKEHGVTARLLVSSYQISCLLGKGGSVMAEMRKFSRAHIFVVPKDLIPRCALEDEEVVQINGEFEAVQETLVQITTRLQHYFFRDGFRLFNLPPNPAFLDHSPYPPIFGRRELSPPRMYSNHGPPFHKFDAFGIPLPPHGLHTREDRIPLLHDIHRFGGPMHLPDRKHLGSQGLLEGDVAGLPGFLGGPQRRITGFIDNHSDAITSTTVDVIVPSVVVPEICGEDDECLKQIREISDAKITIMEPKPGAEETVIIIYGTPEQTHAAQSLIQAFVISETLV